jgi:myo-inositol-1(or 4)-monophosphatase
MALSPNINVMLRAAEKAGRNLIRDFGEVENLQVSTKGPGDFVSAADTRAEEIIHYELEKARPDYSFLMEESGEIKGKDPDNVWIIDPLDGTSNFLHGIPHFCISIALQTKGEIVAGIIFDPVKDEVFRAEKGDGAFMRNRRLRVSGRNDLKSAMVATGLPRRETQAQKEFIGEYERVLEQVPGLRRFGAAALDMAYVAAGRYEGFWERSLNAWDMAAGHIIVKEAGGISTDITGTKNPVHSGSVLCANPNLHTALKKLISGT